MADRAHLPTVAHDPDPGGVLRVLAEGEIRLTGWLAGSTNQARRCRVSLPGAAAAEGSVVLRAVYKPISGERPLHDFPDGTLAFRETAAFEVSAAAALDIVPPTVLRDGPLGPGAVQAWVEPDPETDPVALVLADDPRLRSIALFDAAVNNTDRKAGHLLPLPDGRVLGVDHGVCFSTVPKLRTVLWAWRGEPLLADEIERLERLQTALRGPLGSRLATLLSPPEIRALASRADRLLAERTFPHPGADWPAIPWPPV